MEPVEGRITRILTPVASFWRIPYAGLKMIAAPLPSAEWTTINSESSAACSWSRLYSCVLPRASCGLRLGIPVRWRKQMIRLMLASLLIAFAMGSAAAQTPGTCESKAVSKEGKPLAGAAKNSFMTKCKCEACQPKAVGSDGKPLRGRRRIAL
jgi:hypothetical protein